MAESVKKYLDMEGLEHYNEKLQAHLTSELAKKVDAGKAATDSELGMVKTGDGIENTEGTISVKAKENGAISVTQDGVDVDFSKATKATAATPGVVTIGDGLEVVTGRVSVEPAENGGIEVDGDGVSIKLKSDAGLEITEGEVAIRVKTSGGVIADANGLSVDWQNGPKASLDQYGLIKLGAGLKTGDDGTVQVDAENVVAGSVNWSDVIGKPEDLVHKSDMVSVYKYSGTVDSYDNLPTNLTDENYGNVYNVKDTGMNYAWAGKEAQNADANGWDPLGASFSITSITTDDIDALFFN